MLKIDAKIKFLLTLTLFSGASFSSFADETTKPIIRPRFFNAETIKAVPNLQILDRQDPGYNKVLFKLENFPLNTPITLSMRRLACKTPDQFHPLFTFTIQEDGSFIETQSGNHLEKIVCSSKGFLPGEKVFFRFHNADNAITSECSGIPCPAIFKDKEGNIKLKAELTSLSPTTYKIELPEMAEGEDFDLTSVLGGETKKSKIRFSKSKDVSYSPQGNSRSRGGTSNLTIHRKSGDVYRIKLPWGTALDPYLQGSKIYHPLSP